MKILLMKNKEPVVVYHQNTRVLDHYEQKVIDIIDDKTSNKIQFSYVYSSKEIGWMNNDLTKLSEAMIIYNITSEITEPQ